MRLRIDIHIHSCHSGEAFGTIEEIALRAKSKGLDGFALTDHNSIAGNNKAAQIAKKRGLAFIPGCEIKSREGDIIALGIKKEIPTGLSAEKTIEQIHKQGALAVAAHPFALFLHPKAGVGAGVCGLDFDAIEAFNSRTFIGNKKALEIADKLHLPKVAGSDAHIPEEIGNACTVVDCLKTEKAILREISAGRTEICGTNTSLINIINWAKHRAVRKWRQGE